MDFDAVLDDVMALLRNRRRVSYAALKRQFELDDVYLEDLKLELIEVHQVAVDQDGKMLVWSACSVLEKQMVRRPKRLIRVRRWVG